MMILPQMQFNEDPEILFQFYKLLQLLGFAKVNYPNALAEYCTTLGFDSPAAYVNSITGMLVASQVSSTQENSPYLDGIIPDELILSSHLEALSINQIMDRRATKLSDLKKYPLFRDDAGHYRVIDLSFFAKKMFRGFIFDLHKSTSLSKTRSFENYFSHVAHAFMEKEVFYRTMSAMVFRKFESTHNDADGSGAPDFYYRNNNTIMLTEFKANLLSEELLSNIDDEKFKQHIDERFIETAEKPKAIRQLLQWIGKIAAGHFPKDEKLRDLSSHRALSIYPIICFDDYHYAVTGLNIYLNAVFQELLRTTSAAGLRVKPLTLISLSALNNYRQNGGELKRLPKLLDRYWKMLAGRTLRYQKTGSPIDLVESQSSFDEVYRAHFQQTLKGYVRRDVLQKDVVDEFSRLQADLTECFVI